MAHVNNLMPHWMWIQRLNEIKALIRDLNMSLDESTKYIELTYNVDIPTNDRYQDSITKSLKYGLDLDEDTKKMVHVLARKKIEQLKKQFERISENVYKETGIKITL